MCQTCAEKYSTLHAELTKKMNRSLRLYAHLEQQNFQARKRQINLFTVEEGK